MTVQHIAMVYAASGLEANEKHLLGAYCNHTDPHGYCWPGIDRLADETGMSIRTVKRVNVALKAKNLIRSIRRVHPKTGEPITNLTRVNLPLLESMKRPEREYNDNLIEAITFDGGEDTASETSIPKASDLLLCQSDTYLVPDWHRGRGQSGTGVGVNLAPKTSVETSVETSLLPPSAVPGPLSSHGPLAEEEEAEAESGDNPTPAPAIEVVAWVEALPWRRHPGRRQREHLARLVEGAQAAGWGPDALRRELLAELDGVRSLYAVWVSRLEQLPAPALAPVIPLARSAELAGPSCAQHPGSGRRGAECAGCWSERYG